MTAIYTADLFSTVEGFVAPKPGTGGGYWRKQGPELLDHRLALYREQQWMVFGADTYQLFARFESLASRRAAAVVSVLDDRVMPWKSSPSLRRSPRSRHARTAACS